MEIKLESLIAPFDDTDLRKVLGANLKKLRQSRGLDRVAAADIFKISQWTWRAYEYARIFPSPAKLLEIAAFFNYHVEELLGLHVDLREKILLRNRFENCKRRLEKFGKLSAFRETPIWEYTTSFSGREETIYFATALVLIRFVEGVIEKSLTSSATFEECLRQATHEIFQSYTPTSDADDGDAVLMNFKEDKL